MGTETPKTEGPNEFDTLIDKAFYEIHAPGRSVNYYFTGEGIKPIRVILKELVNATRERERSFCPQLTRWLCLICRHEFTWLGAETPPCRRGCSGLPVRVELKPEDVGQGASARFEIPKRGVIDPLANFNGMMRRPSS